MRFGKLGQGCGKSALCWSMDLCGYTYINIQHPLGGCSQRKPHMSHACVMIQKNQIQQAKQRPKFHFPPLLASQTTGALKYCCLHKGRLAA